MAICFVPVHSTTENKIANQLRETPFIYVSHKITEDIIALFIVLMIIQRLLENGTFLPSIVAAIFYSHKVPIKVRFYHCHIL